MTSSLPLYLLFAEAELNPAEGNRWRFSLEHVGSGVVFAASDVEPIDHAERLELLAVVRGLEALDGPARVTLVTKSRYVSRGLRRCLAEWRQSEWHWERFGKRAPIRDADLWQRIDRALEFHRVDCRLWQFGAVTEPATEDYEDHDSPVALSAARRLDHGRLRVRRLGVAAGRRLRRAAAAACSFGEALGGGGLAAG